MIKLIACAIPILLFIFGQPVLGVIFLGVPIWVFTVSWIIKRNKQRPDESDEDYAKRIECIQTASYESGKKSHLSYESPTKTMHQQTTDNYYYNPMNARMPCNIYYNTPINPDYKNK